MTYLDDILKKLTPDQQEAISGHISAFRTMESILYEKMPEAKKDHEEIYALREQLLKESDRGLCLLAIGRLEVVLSSLLDKKMLGSKTFKKELFGNNGPLATLSSRIKLSFATGIISEGFFKEIDVMRQIRNKFAHSDQPIDFESPEITSLCGNLKLFREQSGRTNRKKFISSYLFVISSVMTNVRMSKPFEAKKETFSVAIVKQAEKNGKDLMDLLDILPDDV